MDPGEAVDAVRRNDVMCFGRAQIAVGNGSLIIGACNAGRYRVEMLRSGWYIFAEFGSEKDECRDVYYGKLLKFLRYTFQFAGIQTTKDLALIEWANGLKLNQYLQVHRPGDVEAAFRNATVEDVYEVLNAIGVLESL